MHVCGQTEARALTHTHALARTHAHTRAHTRTHTQIQAHFAVAFPSGALFLSRLSQFKKAVCGDADPTQLSSGSTTVCAARLLALGKISPEKSPTEL